MRGVVLALLFTLPACRAGKLASVIEDEPMSANEAMNEHRCTAVPDRGAPLIVDWSSYEKTDLEEAMTDGIAVVSYDCEKLELLSECRLAGDYGFMGSVLKQDLISLAGLGEIKANLPTAKLTIGAELSRESSLDLGLLQVGKLRSPLRHASRGELAGDECSRATHFVRGAYVGAYAMRSDTAGRIGSAAELFSFSASARSESAHQIVRSDGDPERCHSADPAAADPPPGCSAILRLELKGIAATEAPIEIETPEESDFSDCELGLVQIEGKCTLPEANVAHVCASSDAADCEAQCEAGNAISCGRLAFMYHYGQFGRPVDLAAAATHYQSACAGEDHFGCAGLGWFLEKGVGGVSSDPAAGEILQREACDAGEPRGCNNLAFLINRRGEHEQALALYQRACAGGWTAACSNVGTFHERGLVVELDLAEANRIYERACGLGDGGGCANLATSALLGRGMASDPTMSLRLLERSCDLGSGRGCFLFAHTTIERGDPPAPAHIALRRGCRLGEADACRELAEQIDAGTLAPEASESAPSLRALACQYDAATCEPTPGAPDSKP